MGPLETPGKYDYTKDTTFRNGRERGLEMYEGYLGIKREALEGKTILNVGTGEREEFETELAEAGIHSKVYSVNPDLSQPEDRQRLLNNPQWNRNTVASVAQALPFKDKYFDYVLAMFSVSVFLHPGENLEGAKLWASESARVLKRGGEIIICPLYKNFYKEYEPLYRIWERMGLKIQNLKNVKLHEVGMKFISWTDKTGNHREPVDPKEESDYCRLVLQKPLKT